VQIGDTVPVKFEKNKNIFWIILPAIFSVLLIIALLKIRKSSAKITSPFAAWDC